MAKPVDLDLIPGNSTVERTDSLEMSPDFHPWAHTQYKSTTSKQQYPLSSRVIGDAEAPPTARIAVASCAVGARCTHCRNSEQLGAGSRWRLGSHIRLRNTGGTCVGPSRDYENISHLNYCSDSLLLAAVWSGCWDAPGLVIFPILVANT